MLIAFAVILIDIIGFTIMVPIFAFYPLSLDASPALTTVLMAMYPIAMFITTPFLGRISDYYGRRPVLMVSMVGATIGYLILANADSLLMIAVARLISGAMAGNIASAQAYMADISSEENRSKAMGLIGAAFGIGFIVGPIIGATLAGDDFATANLRLPAYVSAGLSSLAFFAVAFFLPESLDREHREALRAQPRVGRLAEMKQVMRRPLVKRIVICNLLFNFTSGLFESLFPIWISSEGWGLVTGPQDLIPFLVIGGIAMIVVQGGLIGPMSKRFGEHVLLKVGAIGLALSLVGLALAGQAGSVNAIYVFMGLTSASSALVMTTTQSLVSMRAGNTERGMVIGVFSSLGTLGRASGTVLTGTLFQVLFINAPLYIAALVMVLVAGVAVSVYRHWSDPEPQASLP